MKTRLSITRKLVSALLLFMVLSLTAYAWFYFPLTQYTTVYTDGVDKSQVKAWVFDHQNNIFSQIQPTDDTTIDLDFRSDYDYNEVIQPFFFLWGGEYTTNDFHETIYKVDVTYSNLHSAFPTKLRLYGDFEFESYCIGGDDQPIDIRFMKVMYYLPDNAEDMGYTNPDNYTAFTDTEFSQGIIKDLGLIDLSQYGAVIPVNYEYTLTVYFMVSTDLPALQTYAETLYDETGILDSKFSATANLYYRTEPANVISEP